MTFALIEEGMAFGEYATTDELLLHALDALSDYESAVADIREGMADESAGRIRTIAEADETIRAELGFAK